MKFARGFSLIEVMLAILTVGVMLLMLQAVIHSGALLKTSKNKGIALSIVRNELESLRAGGYANLPVSGTFANSLIDSLPSATTTLVVSAHNAKTKLVTVSVIWQDPNTAASSTVSLSTLITETGGLP
jgi:Tfp pilus assembly protein PilV